MCWRYGGWCLPERKGDDLRAVVQRVKKARVLVDGNQVAAIARGLVVFLGVGVDDREADALYLADKTANLRVFEDELGRMNRSLREVEGELLVVSQFTLWGDCRKGRRPSFTSAAPPEAADGLYREYVKLLREMGLKVETGVFGARMQVEVFNDGPVTLLLDSRRQF